MPIKNSLENPLERSDHFLYHFLAVTTEVAVPYEANETGVRSWNLTQQSDEMFTGSHNILFMVSNNLPDCYLPIETAVYLKTKIELTP